MNHLFLLAAQNTVVALLLATFVFGLTRVLRNPPVAHLLWLLVLLKLVSPPVLPIDWPAIRLPVSVSAREQNIMQMSSGEGRGAPTQARSADPPVATVGVAPSTTSVQAPAATRNDHNLADQIGTIWIRLVGVLFSIWLGGGAICASIAAMRIVRFERLLQGTLPASERLQRIAAELAGKLGIRRVPDLRYVECSEVPFLWCAGRRPTIALPVRLFSQLDDTQAAMILAHELAHLRRRDHWVRGVELIVSIVYWWNPLVWVVRRQIHAAEDLCCDAWVGWLLPDCTRQYAEVVLKTAESLSTPAVGARLLPASPFLHSLSLKARIEMILESRFAPQVSKRSMILVALLSLLVLPSFVETIKTEARADANDEAVTTPADKPDQAAAPADKPDSAAAPAADSDSRPNPKFPHVVKFGEDRIDFLDGDKITILEVRGTAETFLPGNTYWIKGTYTLASHDEARLATYVTAMERKNGSSVMSPSQSTTVKQGSGTFTLILPVSYRGWPHVSFYATGGKGFGGVYFGTADSRQENREGTDETGARLAQNLNAPTTAKFPHALKIEPGKTDFLDGDAITILEIRGTADTFLPGNTYWIKGTYTLASHDGAKLAAYVTAMDRENGRSVSFPSQTTDVKQGSGTFTLVLPMSYRGWPHASFYSNADGNGFGGIYFATDDSAHQAAGNPDTSFLAKRFKYKVPFETGRTQNRNGGRIEIAEVWGTRPQIEIGGQYLVRGKYVLPPGQRGKLFFSASAGGPWGETASLDLQSTAVDEPAGEFELIHGMAGPGQFHLILTEAESYSNWFADVYFGTGDNVYRAKP